MESKSYHKYWGKAEKTKEGDESPKFHLLPYHCLDVAAVGKVLLGKLSLFKDMAKALGMPFDQFERLILFWLAMHDAGKFATAFQNLRKDLLKRLWEKSSTKEYSMRHDSMGYLLWTNFLKDELLRDFLPDKIRSRDKRKVETIFTSFALFSFGHHGKPPEKANNKKIDFYFCDKDKSAAMELMIDFCSLFSLEVIEKLIKRQYKINPAILKMYSWTLAGFFVVCDWIGSNSKLFGYKSEPETLSDYWDEACSKAHKAVESAGLLPAAPGERGGFKELFPDYREPTPLQEYCDTATIPDSPQLWILEDVTGAGKTEAALILTGRIMAKGLADGCYVALPTMATSNAMYERMAEHYKLLFAPEANPSLVLSHGSRHLSEAFTKSVSFKDDVMAVEDSFNCYSGNEPSAEAHCASWIADSSKRSLLAQVGVGTLDQILLGVLPGRHQALRLFGMNRKVLIVDEVHAYDTYMAEVLKRVIKGHRATGGSIILLSATMPEKIRKGYLEAFSDGNEIGNAVEELTIEHYPLVTSLSEDGIIREEPVDTRDSVKRKVAVELFEDSDDVIEVIRKGVEAGQSICWIRNTIGDVKEAFHRLKDKEWIRKDRLNIFHSLYALYDRLAREQDVLSWFGKKSTPETRRGRVLLATQIVEQSLDLDFDILISDLAPIELLIQRAGRLHRHIRDREGNFLEGADKKDLRDNPLLYVLSPPEEARKDWYSSMFYGASYVYPNTAALWRTRELLLKRKEISMPGGARELVEGVYGTDVFEVPECFLASEDEVWGKNNSEKAIALFNALSLKEGYSMESSKFWEEEERIPTRLAGPRRNCYFCREEKGKLVPFYKGKFPWDLSSFAIDSYKLKSIELGHWAREEERIRTGKRKFYDYDLIIPLVREAAAEVQDGPVWTAAGFDDKDRKVKIIYSPLSGLSLERADQEE